MSELTHSGVLPDKSEKTDVYAILDNAVLTGIVNADIGASAAIADTKLSTISTAGKVNLSALTITGQTNGDILYRTATGLARLPIGTTGQKLKVAFPTIDSATVMTVAYDSGELSSPATSITISGLNGDVDEEYELICRIVGGYAGNIAITVRLNADTGANYGNQYVRGSNATADASRDTALTGFTRIGVVNQNEVSLGVMKLQAKSGYVRTSIIKMAGNIATTTVGEVGLWGNSYSETATNLTSMTILAGGANGLGIGSRVILLKKSSSATTKTWEEIYTHTVTGSAVTSLTIPSLTGNTDYLYRMRTRFVNGYNGACNIALRLNNDSGTAYGFQYMYGQNTTASAARNTNTGIIDIGDANNLAEISISEILLYAKSGYVRTAINTNSACISGTTVSNIKLWGWSWNNTADEITQIVLTSNQTGGLGIGTFVALERLNL